jgi:hypothetical protein
MPSRRSCAGGRDDRAVDAAGFARGGGVAPLHRRARRAGSVRAGGGDPAGENHSFDNYFAGFPGADGISDDPPCPEFVPDPPHDRRAALAGPVVPRKDGVESGRCHYAADWLAQYWAWAREFTLCDRYFAELLAPSVPNYFALMGARPPDLDNPTGRLRGRYDETSLLGRLNARGIDWRNYSGGIELVSMFRAALAPDRIARMQRFFADAAAGRLPPVAWVTPAIADSEHPPHSTARGEAWTAGVVDALRARHTGTGPRCSSSGTNGAGSTTTSPRRAPAMPMAARCAWASGCRASSWAGGRAAGTCRTRSIRMLPW